MTAESVMALCNGAHQCFTWPAIGPGVALSRHPVCWTRAPAESSLRCYHRCPGGTAGGRVLSQPSARWPRSWLRHWPLKAGALWSATLWLLQYSFSHSSGQNGIWFLASYYWVMYVSKTNMFKHIPAHSMLVSIGTQEKNHISDVWSLLDFVQSVNMFLTNQFCAPSRLNLETSHVGVQKCKERWQQFNQHQQYWVDCV